MEFNFILRFDCYFLPWVTDFARQYICNSEKSKKSNFYDQKIKFTSLGKLLFLFMSIFVENLLTYVGHLHQKIYDLLEISVRLQHEN